MWTYMLKVGTWDSWMLLAPGSFKKKKTLYFHLNEGLGFFFFLIQSFSSQFLLFKRSELGTGGLNIDKEDC